MAKPVPAPIPESKPTEVPVVNVPPMKFSPGIEEIVTMVESGIEERILLAYVESSSMKFMLSEEEIIYLRDIGTPESVIELLIRLRSRGKEPVVVVESNPEVPPSAIKTPAPPVISQVVQPSPVLKETVTVIQYPQFHSSLAPYGTWIDVAGYGMCWRPTVGVVNVTWRPYHDHGRWLHSDHGWYWHSDYSWGWAPFHYGRWHSSHLHGWVWVPGTVWGPSWVSWRHTDHHYGWAALPPEASYHVGIGFSYRGSKVGLSFGFGLTDHHYTFLRHEHFSDSRPWRHYQPRREIRKIYDNSTVINNYVINSNNTVINKGIDHRQIAKVSRTEIRKVSVRDMPLQRGGKVRPDRIMRSGSDRVVYRPRMPVVSAPGRNALRRQELQKTSNNEGQGRGRSVSGSVTGSASLARVGSQSSRSSAVASKGAKTTRTTGKAASSSVNTVRSNSPTIRRAGGQNPGVSPIQAAPAAPIMKSSANGTKSRQESIARSESAQRGSSVKTQSSLTAVQRRSRLQAIGKSSTPTVPSTSVKSRQSVPSVSLRRNATIQAQSSRSSAASQASQSIQRRRVSAPQSLKRSESAPLVRRELKKSPSIKAPTKQSSTQRATTRAYSPSTISRSQSTRQEVRRTVPQPSRSTPIVRQASPSIRSVPSGRSAPTVQFNRSQMTPSSRRSVSPTPSRVTRTAPRTTRSTPTVQRSAPSRRSAPPQRSTASIQSNRSRVSSSSRSSGSTVPSRSSGSSSQQSRSRR